MIKKLRFISIFLLLVVFISFVSSANYPLPFSDIPEKPDCSDSDPIWDNTKRAWVCPTIIHGSGGGNFEDLECMEITCPDGDQSKCYCSKPGGDKVLAGVIQEDLESVMIGTGDSTTVGGDSVLVEGSSYDSFITTIGDRKLCHLVKGCSDGGCYPMGYIKDNQVCFKEYINGNWYSKFIEQLESGESCSYDFECKSNFCFNQKCVSDIKSVIVDVIQRIFVLEDKSNIKNNLELINSNESEDMPGWIVEIEQNPMQGNYLDTGNEGESKILNFFKRLFSR